MIMLKMGQKSSKCSDDNSLDISLIDDNDKRILKKTLNYDNLFKLIKQAKRVEIKLYKE